MAPNYAGWTRSIITPKSKNHVVRTSATHNAVGRFPSKSYILNAIFTPPKYALNQKGKSSWYSLIIDTAVTCHETRVLVINTATKTARREAMAIQNQKTCPRCNSLLLIKREADGWFEECARCGERNNISDLVTVNTVGQIKILDRIEIKQNPVSEDNPDRV
jgi:ssDNA-binding Zn-finger/Zn-ribbon topoisomerase 1